MDTLRAEIAAVLASLWVDVDVALPYAAGELLARVRERGTIDLEYRERDVRVHGRVAPALAASSRPLPDRWARRSTARSAAIPVASRHAADGGGDDPIRRGRTRDHGSTGTTLTSDRGRGLQRNALARVDRVGTVGLVRAPAPRGVAGWIAEPTRDRRPGRAC